MTGTSSASTCTEHRPRWVVLAAAGLALAVAGCGASAAATATRASGSVRASRPARPRSAVATRAAVGQEVLYLVDHSRTIKYPGRPRQPRPLTTVVRYPLHARGRVPLIVFGHGFAVTPAYYFRLLRAWATAGFVVAAPVFPLENQHAPGGPNESDLDNQPRDMSFVITQLLAASASGQGPLAKLVNPRAIAVSGQSDGGETALATAYDRHFLDRRVKSAAILSGAELPGAGHFYFPRHSPPLLAVQGTGDTVNQPRFTYAFFAAAPRPKYLLKLLGAPHLPPYTYEQPQLAIVERVTIAFFDRYLKREHTALDGNVPGVARLVARP